MLPDVQVALWFMVPAAIANAFPIFLAPLPGLRRWNAPMDGGRTYKGQPILGVNKTWRGLIGGMIIATVILALQKSLVSSTGWAADWAGPVDYAALPVLILGPLMGLGALGGDAVESFIKRRRGIEPGKKWFPFDQLDYIIGAVLVSLPFVRLPLMVYAWIFIAWFFIHLIATYIGWLMGLKKAPI